MTRGTSIDCGVIFYPRGGSAQVIRYLLPRLAKNGHTARLFCGSIGAPGDRSHAETFYDALSVVAADYSDAVAAAKLGRDPIAEPVPLHPSYEDRNNAPDRVFAAVSPAVAQHLTRFWRDRFAAARVGSADIMHLHHLTPQHAAARDVRGRRPIVTTLHGTELKLIEAMRERVGLAAWLDYTVDELATQLDASSDRRNRTVDRLARGGRLDDRAVAMLRETQWSNWRYAPYWLDAMRRYSRLADRVVVISDQDRAAAADLLGIDDTEQIPNGVDTNRFRPHRLGVDDRIANLRRWLVDQPQGWKPGQPAGSIAYSEADLARVRAPDGRLRPLLLWIGRFLDFKRLPLLIRAFARARHRLDPPPVLIAWGGYPGEFEGEHPVETARAADVLDDVYFVGWRDHDELAHGLNLADVMVAPAVGEPFGLVYLESMACGTPVIATPTGGPARFVRATGESANGWLAKPDDEADLAATIVAAVRDAGGRRQRSEVGPAFVRQRYSWPAVADAYSRVYEDTRATAGQATTR